MAGKVPGPTLPFCKAVVGRGSVPARNRSRCCAVPMGTDLWHSL